MALSAYAMEGHHLINNMTRTQLWTGGLSESLVRHGMVSKVSTLVGNYLNGLAVDPQLGGLPIALNSLVRVDDHYLKMKPPKEWRPLLTPMADSYVDAVRRKGEAKERFEQARDKGNKQEAREAARTSGRPVRTRRMRGRRWRSNSAGPHRACWTRCAGTPTCCTTRWRSSRWSARRSGQCGRTAGTG
ncbi:hypothetical protein ACFQX6_63480 [Streptosporangium lutulentum]